MGAETGTASPDTWARALTVLAQAHPAAAGSLIGTVTALREVGAVLFEVISGTPAGRYGARLTFRAGADADAFAAAGGFADHPWGRPDWIGVRTTADGTTRCKAYHRRPPPLGLTIVHRGLPPGCEPVMAALDRDAVEIYAVAPGQRAFSDFAAQCVEPLGLAARAPDVPLVARARSLGLSARHVGDRLTAITVFAFDAGLPADEHTHVAWTGAMTADERAAHDLTLGAVASLGHRLGRRYGLLAWSYERSGFVSRAASIRATVTAPHPP